MLDKWIYVNVKLGVCRDDILGWCRVSLGKDCYIQLIQAILSKCTKLGLHLVILVPYSFIPKPCCCTDSNACPSLPGKGQGTYQGKFARSNYATDPIFSVCLTWEPQPPCWKWLEGRVLRMAWKAWRAQKVIIKKGLVVTVYFKKC